VLHLNDISGPINSSVPIRASSIMLRLRAAGSRQRSSTSPHKGVPYRVNQVPSSTRWQIFLRDPNNVEIELNFETKNETAA